MPQYVYLLDLVDDPEKIAQYEAWHTKVWPEVLENLQARGIRKCQIFRAGNRLAMLLESDAPTSSDGRGSDVPQRVTEWEELMSQFQQPLPFAQPGEKWVLANRIFDWKC